MNPALHSSAFEPYDGSNIDPSAIVYAVRPPSLSGLAHTVYAPAMYPEQAAWMARNVKTSYLSLSAFYQAIDPISGFDNSETFSVKSMVKRYCVPGNDINAVRFVAQKGSLGVIHFVLDFSIGQFMMLKYGSIKMYGFFPRLTFSSVSSSQLQPGAGIFPSEYVPFESYSLGNNNHGAFNVAASYLGAQGTLSLSGMPSVGRPANATYSTGTMLPIGFNVEPITPSIQLDGGYVIQQDWILTERYDKIYASQYRVARGSTLTLTCPPVNSAYDDTGSRSGFADVQQVLCAGSSTTITPLTKAPAGSTISSGPYFSLSSSKTGATAVQDKITFVVPSDAQTGPIAISAAANTTSPSTTQSTTDNYTTNFSIQVS